MSALHKRIQEDLTASMKARDALRTSTLRMVQAALKNERIALLRELTDEDVVRVLQKGVRSRAESVRLFRQGGREELAAKEEAEMAILEAYLPSQLSPAEVDRAAAELIQELGIKNQKELGLFMKEFMKRYQGRADGKVAQAAARRLLEG